MPRWPRIGLLGVLALAACSDDPSLHEPATAAVQTSAAAEVGSASVGGGSTSSAGGSSPSASAGAAGMAGRHGGAGGASVGCEVSGSMGECIDVADCGEGHIAVPGFCPGPANIQCCIAAGARCDPDAFVLPNGGLTEGPGEGGCPLGMVRIEAFCIDRYESGLVGLDGSAWSPYFNPGATLVRAVSVEGAIPQAYISGVQAGAACVNAGKRLCTDEEWLRACGGPSGTTYPYGDALEPGVCNDARAVHPAIEYFGTTDDWIWSELGNACLDQLPDSLDRAGSNAGCVTAEGIFDMMGNLHEWTADPQGTFRGGYFVDTQINGPGCLYVTTAHDTSHWDYSTGFRCCADAR